MTFFRSKLVYAAVLAWSTATTFASTRSAEFRLESAATDVNRVDAVVRVQMPLAELGLRADSPEVASLTPGSLASWTIVARNNSATPRPVEVERVEDSLRLTWVEPGDWPAGETRRWAVRTESPAGFRSPWSWSTTEDGQRELRHAERGLVLRYVAEPIIGKNLAPIQKRAAYIHPFLTPSGKTVTGDFSPFHAHHRGFFLSYAKTKRGDDLPDFWNFHLGTAKIVPLNDHLRTVAGPVTARLNVRHDWQLREKDKPEIDSGESVLDETWEVEVYDVPGQPAWIWDITTTQTPRGQDLTLVKHRYGGMAYRGPEPFVKGALDVLTSEGNDNRAKADQKAARWIDMTGPVAEGSSEYLGAVMCDHPGNPRFPNVVRIHPTLLPFFSFVPAHREDMVLTAGKPATWRYRTMVHDGRPNKARDEALFADYASPVMVKIAESR